jgi:hypothetical protein
VNPSPKHDDHNEVVILFNMKDVAATKKLASSEDLLDEAH